MLDPDPDPVDKSIMRIQIQAWPARHQQLGVDDVPRIHGGFVLLGGAFKGQVGEGGGLTGSLNRQEF